MASSISMLGAILRDTAWSSFANFQVRFGAYAVFTFTAISGRHPTSEDYYTLEMDGTHTFVLTATQDLDPGTTPGIKQVHLMAPGFINPSPAEHFITVESETGPGGALETGSVAVIPASEGNQKVASSGALGAGSNSPLYANTLCHRRPSARRHPTPWTSSVGARRRTQDRHRADRPRPHRRTRTAMAL